MGHEGEPPPFCFGNRDLDCPPNCPLNSSAHDYVHEIAESEQLTFEEVIAKYRVLDEKRKESQRMADQGLLALTGNSERCLINRRGKI